MNWTTGVLKSPILEDSLAVFAENENKEMGACVCVVSPLSTFTDDDDYNAYLISKTPELLDLLERAFIYVDEMENENYEDLTAGVFKDKKLSKLHQQIKELLDLLDK
jgi:hypothetical protein